jgi:hypothetical protein
MASPRELIDANRPDKGYFLPKDLVGDPIVILPEYKTLESDYTESGTRLHIQVKLQDGTEVTLQPSEGLRRNEIQTLIEHDALPCEAKVGTYPTKFGEGYRLVFPEDDDWDA